MLKIVELWTSFNPDMQFLMTLIICSIIFAVVMFAGSRGETDE